MVRSTFAALSRNGILLNYFLVYFYVIIYTPMLKRLADEYKGRIKVLKVDVDKNQALAVAAQIQSIPTLFFITKNGDIERIVGGLPAWGNKL